MGIEETRASLTSAEEQTAAAAAEALAIGTAWLQLEAVDVEKFLVEEGRLTVINQSSVTAENREQIPALRQKIEDIAARCRRAVEQWTTRLTADETLSGWNDLGDTFRKIVKPFHEEFGNTMEELGYDPGQGDTFTSTWLFYYPLTGTARTKYVPFGRAHELSDALSKHATLAARSRELARQIHEQEARDLWGS